MEAERRIRRWVFGIGTELVAKLPGSMHQPLWCKHDQVVEKYVKPGQADRNEDLADLRRFSDKISILGQIFYQLWAASENSILT